MNKKNVKMAQLAMLIAIQIVLTITPLGFLPLGFMTVVLIHIPVLVGAMVLGPASGALLGLVFGISSIISANLRGTPDVIVFSPFLSGSPWSLVVAIVPRVLFALIAAYLYILISKSKLPKRVSAGISAGVATFAHTVMVLGAVYFFFRDYYADLMGVAVDTLMAVFAGIAASNGTLEAIVAVLACVALVPPLSKAVAK